MFKPVFFDTREHPLHPTVEMMCECELRDAAPIFVLVIVEIIRIAETYGGRLMEKQPSVKPGTKNGVAFSFTLIFPNKEVRERFLAENGTGTIGSG